MKNRSLVRGVLLWSWLFSVGAASSALAQTVVNPIPPAAGSSSSSLVSTIRERARAIYTMWVTGPTVGALDGKVGQGEDLMLNQFAMVGYKLSSKWTMSATQYWTNKVRNQSDGSDNLTFMDPYVSFTNASVTKSTRYGTNLLFQARYYMPLAHESIDSRGTKTDNYNGRLRVRVEPSKTWADGVIQAKMTTIFVKSFASSEPLKSKESAQRDHILWLYPSVTFNIHDKFQPYVAYSNYIEHFQDRNRGGEGRWNSWNDKQNWELGFNWQPLDKVNINPYIEYAPAQKARNSSIGFIAEYAFL